MLDSAIDELLRYDSPVQSDSRIAREQMEIGGKPTSPGQRVICLLGTANHDPATFAEPDVLVIGRDAGSHVAFDRGWHYCLGSPLARPEGRIAFQSLLSHYKSLRMVEEPQYRSQVTLRGLESLWLEVE